MSYERCVRGFFRISKSHIDTRSTHRFYVRRLAGRTKRTRTQDSGDDDHAIKTIKRAVPRPCTMLAVPPHSFAYGSTQIPCLLLTIFLCDAAHCSCGTFKTFKRQNIKMRKSRARVYTKSVCCAHMNISSIVCVVM